MNSKTLVSQRVLHRSSLLLRLYQVPVVGFRCCCGCCLFIFCSTHLGQCERGIETVEWDLITPGRKTQQFGSKVLIKGDGKVKEEGEKEGGRRRKTKKVMHTISKKSVAIYSAPYTTRQPHILYDSLSCLFSLLSSLFIFSFSHLIISPT
jgi:hypothetical protein